MKNQMTIAMLNAAIELHKRIESAFVGDKYPIYVRAFFDGIYDPDTAAEKMAFAIDTIMAAMEAMDMPINSCEAEQFFHDYGYHKKTVEEAYSAILKDREIYAAQVSTRYNVFIYDSAIFRQSFSIGLFDSSEEAEEFAEKQRKANPLYSYYVVPCPCFEPAPYIW